MLQKVIQKAIFIIGDSIATGSGDSSNTSTGCMGYIERGLALQYPIHRASLPNDKGYIVANNIMPKRFIFSQYCNIAICQYGVNDLRYYTENEIKDALLKLWEELNARGMKVYQCTITPVTTSIDEWVTTENQTTAEYNNIRVSLNEWIRTKPYPLSGYFEIADLAETSRNSGIWKASYTDDGTHPNVTGHTALSVGIDTTKLEYHSRQKMKNSVAYKLGNKTKNCLTKLSRSWIKQRTN